MSPIAAPFVIIMNDDLESSYMQWRVVHRDPTLADARLHNQYASVIASYPRDHYRVAMMEAKTLIHNPSGIVKWGTIYRLSELAARVQIKKFAMPAGENGRRVKMSPRAVKMHVVSLGEKNAKPGIKGTFAPFVAEKTSRSPKRRKIGT
jgi:hypothetical protein